MAITSSLLRPPLRLPFNITTATKNFSSSPTAKCSANHNNNNSGGSDSEQRLNLKDAVGDRVEELLKSEENKSLLVGLEEASLRVEKAKRQVAEIERQQLEAKKARAYIEELERRASEIEECEREISKARELAEEAERALRYEDEDDDDDDKSRDRIESLKAALVAAIVGTLAGLPIAVAAREQLVLAVAVNVVSCALFGVTYRYTIRRDIDDVHLKSGAWTAFGIVRGLGSLSGGEGLEMNIESIKSRALEAAFYVSKDLFVFVSAAVALDYCLKVGLLVPFPSRSESKQT